ncbi:phosphopentomutase [Clostridia bacterium]|nr:phosphopentomutase [Clostridia bacterium]
MNRTKRIFLIVLDSVGIGEMPDAADYGDTGSNTLRTCMRSPSFSMPNMARLGFFHIDGVREYAKFARHAPTAAYARMAESSKGKDTIIGHWEIAGVISPSPLPTYPNGFPKELLQIFSRKTGRGILCNRPYSGTQVLEDYGKMHMRTGDLIVYTSADSVFQIAAHEDIVSVEDLYKYCEIARELLTGEHGVGRVIARPFRSVSKDKIKARFFQKETPARFFRTVNRHDFSLPPPALTMLDQLVENGKEVLAVGKIHDIFAGSGITDFVRTGSNKEGIDRTLDYMKRDFEGLCFTNLVDYDMLYGHRNDVDGYAAALSSFDKYLPKLLDGLGENDLLMITADHGCDPGTGSTDHSREYTPFLLYGAHIMPQNLGTRKSFADIGASVLDYFGIESKIAGESLLQI